MVLALATGITPSQWVDEGEQAIVTAFELLEQQNRSTPEPRRSGGSGKKWTRSNPQMSG